MTKGAAFDDLRNLGASLRFQSTNPYNHSTKEKHVRDLLREYADRVEAALAVLETPKKASKRGK